MKEKTIFWSAAVALSTVFITTSCLQSAQISAEDLRLIVQRDSSAFDVQSIPDDVLGRLGSHRVVVVGENHHLREHREFVTNLLTGLHAHGFRQLLFEWTQAADWLLDDFVLDGGLEPNWAPPSDIGGEMITAIRDFNRTLPEEERIRVRPIDVTLQDYGGGDSFYWSLQALARHLEDPGPISALLQGDYRTGANQIALLEVLQNELGKRRSELISVWSQQTYGTVVEMVEVELTSVSIRAIRQTDYDKSVRLREDAMKSLVDARLDGFAYGTLINVGNTHAQKERLWGTRIEWLGDYLVHESQAAGGSTIVLEVAAAKTVFSPGSGIPDRDLGASPQNELFRVMNGTSPDQIVFLPMDDPVFGDGRVPVNIGGDVFVGTLGRHFDVAVLLPLAHLVSPD